MENNNWNESIENILNSKNFKDYYLSFKSQKLHPKTFAASFVLLGYLSAKEEEENLKQLSI